MTRLNGRHALVTGGSRGIGRAIAAALVEKGAKVTILGRDRRTLDAAAAELGSHGVAEADVTDAVKVAAAVRAAEAALGPVDLLIANAGAVRSARFGRTEPETFEALWAVNVMGTVHACRSVLPGMAERGFGRIVAIASTAGLKGYPYVTAYCAAKHAVVGFVRALAVECATTGVTVNAVCPGFTDTDIVKDAAERIMRATGRSRDEAVADLVRHNPQGRLIAPAEVADAVVWLCGDGSGAVTGQAIAVAGGEI